MESGKLKMENYKTKTIILNSPHGQIVLILLLVMTVALAIGLSIVQGSLTDITTSTKVEQSSRAFSAAEAGIERALQGSGVATTESFDNNALFNLRDSGLLPKPAYPPLALEYPPVSKEEIVHIWLSNPALDNDQLQLENPADPIGKYYAQEQFEVYWGNPQVFSSDSEQAAVELTVVYYDEEIYRNKKILLDPDAGRLNNFLKPGATDPNVNSFQCAGYEVDTIFAADRKFACKAELIDLPQPLVLLRARVLYSNASHPFAVKPHGVSGCSAEAQMKDCSLPPQVRIVQSEGKAGDTQRTIQLFTVEKVVPFYFDYAIFSAGDINK